MSDPFVGEICAFAFDFAPENWAICAGQSVSRAQHEALYTVIADLYGSASGNDFKLPDLRGRTAMGSGSAPSLSPRSTGRAVGARSATLALAQLPAHAHTLQAEVGKATAGNAGSSGLLARGGTYSSSKPVVVNTYNAEAADATLAATAVTIIGGGSSHDNQQPYLALNLCISLSGEYPT